tara:strand:- start:2236 stop:3231 length:996 start_codon:yes stop_codon:yes gene_type:complete
MTEIIAEIGQAHDGSLGLLHSYIDSLAKLDIDTIKFQTHIAEAESSEHEKFRIKFSYQDKTRFDYWKRMQFSMEQWREIKEHCEDLGLNFLSTPFSNMAVDLLEEIKADRYKIGSGDVSNFLLIDRILQTKMPIIVSSGLCDYEELDKTIAHLCTNNSEVTLLQCTSSYPTDVSDIGLNLIPEFAKRYNIPVGLSDHSGKIFPSLAATIMGAEILEVHVVFDQMMFGPDSTSSIPISKMNDLVEGVRMIDKIKQNPVSKSIISNETKSVFTRSLAFNKDLNEGDKIKFSDLESKKPGNFGISPIDYKSVIGKKLKRRVKRWEFVNEDQFDE